MGKDNGALEVLKFIMGDKGVGQETKTGVDAVDYPAAIDEFLNRRYRFVNGMATIGSELEMNVFLGHGPELGKGDSTRIDYKCMHDNLALKV